MLRKNKKLPKTMSVSTTIETKTALKLRKLAEDKEISISEMLRRIIRTALLSILIVIAFSFQSFAELEIKRVVSIYDGDTFKVDLDCDEDLFCKNISVRVIGIDTPEMKSDCLDEKFKAVAAKEYASQFLTEGDVFLVDCQRDKYFRILCSVKNENNEDLSSGLIKAGLAVEYDGGTKIKWCEKGEK